MKTYKGFAIITGQQIELPNGKRRGVLEIYEPGGNLIGVKSYIPKNGLSRAYARSQAKKLVDKYLDNRK